MASKELAFKSPQATHAIQASPARRPQAQFPMASQTPCLPALDSGRYPVFASGRIQSAIPGLQRKLQVGSSSDPLEQEADQVAARITRSPSPAEPSVSSATPKLQRKCSC